MKKCCVSMTSTITSVQDIVKILTAMREKCSITNSLQKESQILQCKEIIIDYPNINYSRTGINLINSLFSPMADGGGKKKKKSAHYLQFDCLGHNSQSAFQLPRKRFTKLPRKFISAHFFFTGSYKHTHIQTDILTDRQTHTHTHTHAHTRTHTQMSSIEDYRTGYCIIT